MRGSRILLGVIGRPHGVRGLVRVTSYTDPPEAIELYGPLSDDHGRQFALRWHGDGIAEITDIIDGAAVKITDRAMVEKLTNCRLYAPRDRLPAPAADEFYLADLIGLVAIDRAGAPIGKVVAVHDYGAGASLEIAGPDAMPLLVPFTRAAVPIVDIDGGRLTVLAPEPVELAIQGAPPPARSHKGRGSRGSHRLPLREGAVGPAPDSGHS